MEDLDLDKLDSEINQKNAIEDRFRNLTAARKEAEAKAEAEAQKTKDLEARLAASEKDKEFLSSFSDSVTKFPGAAEYRDKIKEKFNSGYSLEDAAISILHAEGKLTQQQTAVVRESPMGGSAINQIQQPQNKTVAGMSKEDMLNALKEAEQKGDISMR